MVESHSKGNVCFSVLCHINEYFFIFREVWREGIDQREVTDRKEIKYLFFLIVDESQCSTPHIKSVMALPAKATTC